MPASMTVVQNMVHDWANETFPERDLHSAITKLIMAEIPEFMHFFNMKNYIDQDELADLFIILLDLASMAGINAEQAIQHKHQVNLKRTWTKDQNSNTWSHSNDEANEPDVPTVEIKVGQTFLINGFEARAIENPSGSTSIFFKGDGYTITRDPRPPEGGQV